MLLDRGADIGTKVNWDDRTPLLIAAERGLVETVRLLLDRGADIETRDWGDRVPLHWVARWGLVATVRLLLDRGADIEAKDNGDRTPLDIASRNEMREIALLLIRRGALVRESAIAEAPNGEIRAFLEGMAGRPRLGFEFGKTFNIRKASGAEYPGGIGSHAVEIQMLGEDGQWTTVVPEAIRWDLPFAIFRAVAAE